MTCRERKLIMNAFISSQFSCPILWMYTKTETHHLNKLLAIEIDKALNNLSSPFMSDLFRIKDTKYNLRKGNALVSEFFKTTSHGLASVSYLESVIWDQTPAEINSLNVFKEKIKIWIQSNCPCRICKNYVQNLGFI